MKKNKKGFTLAELLIVVAIIAVLVAIAIPVLNNSLEKSRQAADAANIRAAYAQAVTAMMVSNADVGFATTQATMKTNRFDLLNEGDTLAGISFSQLASAHSAKYKVSVAVTIDKTYFTAVSGTNSGTTVAIDNPQGSVSGQNNNQA